MLRDPRYKARGALQDLESTRGRFSRLPCSLKLAQARAYERRVAGLHHETCSADPGRQKQERAAGAQLLLTVREGARLQVEKRVFVDL